MVKLGKIPVEILKVRTDDKGRCFAEVMACKGEPFIDYSMGGAYHTAYRTVRIEYLKKTSEGIFVHDDKITQKPAEVLNGI